MITFTFAVVCPIPRLLHSIQRMDGVPWLNAELHMWSALQINKTTNKNCNWSPETVVEVLDLLSARIEYLGPHNLLIIR